MQPKGFTSATGTFLQQPGRVSAWLQVWPRVLASAAATILQKAAAVLSSECMQAVHWPVDLDGMQGGSSIRADWAAAGVHWEVPHTLLLCLV